MTFLLSPFSPYLYRLDLEGFSRVEVLGVENSVISYFFPFRVPHIHRNSFFCVGLNKTPRVMCISLTELRELAIEMCLFGGSSDLSLG